MAGTVAGGKAARDKNYERYGKDFYRVQGAKGGKKKVPKGFALNRELARTAGAKGGRIGKPGSAKA